MWRCKSDVSCFYRLCYCIFSILSINERHSEGLTDDKPLSSDKAKTNKPIASIRPIAAHITPAIARPFPGRFLTITIIENTSPSIPRIPEIYHAQQHIIDKMPHIIPAIAKPEALSVDWLCICARFCCVFW